MDRIQSTNIGASSAPALQNNASQPVAPAAAVARVATLPPKVRSQHAASRRPAEAPEAREVEREFAAMVQRVLGRPSAAYTSVVPQGLRDPTAAITVLTDAKGRVGYALLRKALDRGWAAWVADHGAALADKRQGYGLGPLDGLLYRGSITPHEYWTASTVFALWRDSQTPAMPAIATMGRPGEPVAFGGSYTRWDAVKTFDLTVKADRETVLRRSYLLPRQSLSVHRHSVARAAQAWGASTERFAYLVPMHRTGTFPWFGLIPFLTGTVLPWRIDASAGERLPVLPLSLFQHDVNLFSREPLTAVPRLGVDSVSRLQEQILASSRAAGISHGFPWSDTTKKLHADFLATGEAGFAWHDLGHLMVGSVEPSEARRALVLLHRELSAHAKTLPLPEMIGRIPFRKLFMGRLFGLTDQSNSQAQLDAVDALMLKTTSIVAEALPDLIMNTNAAKAANVQSNLLAHLPLNTVLYHGTPDPSDQEWVHAKLGFHPVWELDSTVHQLGAAWDFFVAEQFHHARQWLQSQGYDIAAAYKRQTFSDIETYLRPRDGITGLVSCESARPESSKQACSYNVQPGVITAHRLRLHTGSATPFKFSQEPEQRWDLLEL